MQKQSDKLETGKCALCDRDGVLLTRHHLIPKTRHRSKRARRLFSRTELSTRILLVCRPCHTHIHTIFSEKELEREYNTHEALLGNEEIRRFSGWISKKPAGYRPTSRRVRR